MSIAVESFNEEAILFFADRDALHANLIQHLANGMKDTGVTKRGPH
jgi:hypothetical protein